MQQAFDHSSARSSAGFSLIEVVVAVGIFAIAIVSVIGLLGPINKSVADVRDFDDASRVVAALQGELQRAGFSNVANFIDNNTSLYADRTGRRIGQDNAADNSTIWNRDISGQALTDLNGNGSTTDERDAQKFFSIKLTRNSDLSPNSAQNPDTSAGFLAFTITLRWPAYLPNGTPISDSSQQSVMVIPAAITR